MLEVLLNCLGLIKMAVQFVRGCESLFSCCHYSGAAPSETAAERAFLLPHGKPVPRRQTEKLSRLSHHRVTKDAKQSTPDHDRITKGGQADGIHSVFVPLFPALKLKQVGAWNGNHDKKWFADNWLDCTGSRFRNGWNCL